MCIKFFICIFQIIHIRSGYAKLINESLMRSKQKLIKYDIIIKEYTSISFHGFYNIDVPDEDEIKTVTFTKLSEATGLVRMYKFI